MRPFHVPAGVVVAALLAFSLSLPPSRAGEGGEPEKSAPRCKILFDNGLGTAIVEFPAPSLELDAGLLGATQAGTVLDCLARERFWENRRWTGHEAAIGESYRKQGKDSTQLVIRYELRDDDAVEKPLLDTIDKLRATVIEALIRQPGIRLALVANGYRGEPAHLGFIDPEGKGRKADEYPWDADGPIWGFQGLTEVGQRMPLPEQLPRDFFIYPHCREEHGHVRGAFDEERAVLQRENPGVVYVAPGDPDTAWPCQPNWRQQHDRQCGGAIIPFTPQQIRESILGRAHGIR